MAVEQLGYQEALSRRLEVFRADVLRTLGLLVLLAGVVVALVWKSSSLVALLVLVLVTTVDLWNVDRRYFNDEKVNGCTATGSKQWITHSHFHRSPR